MPSTRKSKEFLYRYNGDPNSEEAVFDPDGEMPIPPKDSFINRNGKRWKVVQVNEQRELSRNAIPIYRIFVTDQF